MGNKKLRARRCEKRIVASIKETNARRMDEEVTKTHKCQEDRDLRREEKQKGKSK